MTPVKVESPPLKHHLSKSKNYMLALINFNLSIGSTYLDYVKQT